MKANERPIAVLDSGVGGLTVVKELLKQLPNESIVYYGDTARAPYGPRPYSEIITFTEQLVQQLLVFHPKLMIIACNTATAVALEQIQFITDIPVIGVIEPGSRAAIKATSTGFIGVIGTEATIQSNAYLTQLLRMNGNIKIISQACPTFVPLVEKGEYRSAKAYQIVAEAISHMRLSSIDCLILGCTHYPFLADIIAEVMGDKVTLIHSAEETALQAQEILLQQDVRLQQSQIITVNSTDSISPPKQRLKHYFICSGDLISFQKIVKQWLAEYSSNAEFIYIQRKEYIE